VYTLDCEMCYSTRGFELLRVSVVAADGSLSYDSLVRPEGCIIDYNTRFSGITAVISENLRKKPYMRFSMTYWVFIHYQNILVSHGFRSEIRDLPIICGTVIYTSVVFPPYYGHPHRCSLKSLARSIFKRKIQCSPSGHDSFEFGHACLELMLWRLRIDFGTIP
jgi:RNA exonuclease 1